MEVAQTSLGHPPWHGQMGVRRVMSEFRYMTKQIASNSQQQMFDLETVNDDAMKWRFKLHNFDSDTEGGRNLNKDLLELDQKYGHGYILMEISFPADYPTRPFFLRVVRPRCQWYTGHVTAGGSICVEMLTLSRSNNSWNSSYCVDSVLQIVFANMIDCEQVFVQTPTGPGGLSGPLRIDLARRYSRDPMQEYSEYEAKSAFERMVKNHQQHGWGSGSATNPGKPSTSPKLYSPKAGTLVPPGAFGHRLALRNSAIPVASASTASTSAQIAGNAAVSSSSKAGGSSSSKAARQTLGLASASAVEFIDITDDVQACNKRKRCDDVVDLTASPDHESDIVIVGEKRPVLEDREKAKLRRVAKQKAELEHKLQQLQSELNAQKAGTSLPANWTPAKSDQHAPTLEDLVVTAAIQKLRSQPIATIGTQATGDLGCEQARFSQAHIDELAGQGLTREDAMAALEACDGDMSSAVLYAVVCQDHGGPSAIRCAGSTSSHCPVREVVQVLQRFCQSSNLKYDKVVKVQRVQHPRLWRKYCMRRDEVAESANGNSNEHWLFHGAAKDNLTLIINEGFDIRVSNLNGALGMGVYFAASSQYSDSYARMPHNRAVGVGGASMAVGTSLSALMAMGMAGGSMMVPGWPSLPGPQAAASYAAAAAMAATLPQRHSSRHKRRHAAAGAVSRTAVAAAAAVAAPAQPSTVAMLLCRVTLGRVTGGSPGLRRPPPNFDSTTASGHIGRPLDQIYAVYDNAQAYPAYIIHYTP